MSVESGLEQVGASTRRGGKMFWCASKCENEEER